MEPHPCTDRNLNSIIANFLHLYIVFAAKFYKVVLQDLLVAANGFFLKKQSSTLGRGLDSGQRA